MSPHGPFLYNPSEIPPDELEASFIGRHRLLERLLLAVKEQTDTDTVQHYLLLGPRGIGKTTLLLMLYKSIKEDPDLSAKWLPVRYREEEFYVYTLRDLLALALENLHAEEDVPEARELLEAAEEDASDETSLARIIDGLGRIANRHHKKILLLIDNFDQIFPKQASRNKDKHAFRKLLSTKPFLMVIGTSVRLFEEFAAYDEAFFNFFSPVDVENLSDDDIQTLIRTRAELDGNHEFLQNYAEHKDKIRAITHLTGGNPRLVLMLYDILSRRSFLPVVQALRETIDQLTPLLKDILEDLPRQQSKILDALMRMGGSATPSEIAAKTRLSLNTVTTQLGRLKSRRLVEGKNGRAQKPAIYRIRDQMFRTWYQMRYLRPSRRRVELFVEFVRAWFSVEERMASLDRYRREFDASLASGARRQARDIAHCMEYFAASFEEKLEGTRQIERVADCYFAAGAVHEAALSLAELRAPASSSESRIESVGYSALGERMMVKGQVEDAIKMYSEALKKDKDNVFARMGLGWCYGKVGRYQKALREFALVIDLQQIKLHIRLAAVLSQAFIKSLLNDMYGAIEDCTVIISKGAATPNLVAKAFVLRGENKGKLGDTEGEIDDYNAVIKMKAASKEVVVEALYNRGVSKGKFGDIEVEINDYNTVIDMETASPELVARALLYRGVSKGRLGDTEGEIGDYNAVIDLKEAPKEVVAEALYNRGESKRRLGDIDGAIEDYRDCARMRIDERMVRESLKHMAELLFKNDQQEEAMDWLAQWSELEPDDTPLEPRIEARIDTIVYLSKTLDLDAAAMVLETLLKTSPPDLRDRLAFLKPGLEYAKSNDISCLEVLPEEERDMAERIAEKIIEGQETPDRAKNGER